jgi:diguanylate cyclase (GGDEF)-like protein
VTKPFVPEVLMARARVAVRVKAQIDALVTDAARDPLTGLWNRRLLLSRGRELIAFAKRHELSLCAAMMDVDHFKRINDGAGHAAGDLVLKGVGQRLRAALRESDLLFRYGGEEFLALATQRGGGGAWQLAERLRQSVAAQPLVLSLGDDPREVPVTISVGVATWAPGESVGGLLRRADEALYQSKQQGRNRSTLWRGEGARPRLQQ